MKGVMDFADHGHDDHLKDFAARAAAECLLWFLRARVSTDLVGARGGQRRVEQRERGRRGVAFAA
jgi:hypothetical protein